MGILDKYFIRYVSISCILCTGETKFNKLCINLTVGVYYIITKCVSKKLIVYII